MSGGVQCSICKELCVHDLSTSYCGHIYHFKCISRWLQGAKTCPECRAAISESRVIRLYPSFNESDISENVREMQDQVLALAGEVEIRNRKLASVTAQYEGEKMRLNLIRRQITSEQHKNAQLKSHLEVLTTKEGLLAKKCKSYEMLREQNQNLRDRMRAMTGLQKILTGLEPEVEKLLQTYNDKKTTVTFAVALKWALAESETEKAKCMASLAQLRKKYDEQLKKNAHLTAKVARLNEMIGLSSEPNSDAEDTDETVQMEQQNERQIEQQNEQQIEQLDEIEQDGEIDEQPNEPDEPTQLDQPSTSRGTSSASNADDEIEIVRPEVKRLRRNRASFLESELNVSVTDPKTNSPYLPVKQGWLNGIMRKRTGLKRPQPATQPAIANSARANDDWCNGIFEGTGKKKLKISRMI